MTPPPPPTTYPGDSLIPTATMIYDRKRHITTPASHTFPWLLQLGAGRGGWYLPWYLELLVPRTWRGARAINPAWQDLRPGDRVEDYKMGMGRDDEFFTVVSVDPPSSLVYVTHRLGTVFTWTLMCRDLRDEEGRGCEVHLRFRGRVEREGWQRRVLVWGGDWVDWVFTEPMLRGLQERCEAVEGKGR